MWQKHDDCGGVMGLSSCLVTFLFRCALFGTRTKFAATSLSSRLGDRYACTTWGLPMWWLIACTGGLDSGVSESVPTAQVREGGSERHLRQAAGFGPMTMPGTAGMPGPILQSPGPTTLPKDGDGDGVSWGQDCDDADAAVGAPTLVLWRDEDGDSFGGTVAVAVCAAGDGYSAVSGDCDDSLPTVHPGGSEVCDGMDNDCDGAIDNNPLDPTTVWPDTDGDGAGAGTSSIGCPYNGWSASNDDCDDGDASIHPGADEYCDGVDHDCDGSVNESSSVDAPFWYLDGDEDGYGDPSTMFQRCTSFSGLVNLGGDCDDMEASINPSASEYCNSLDDDCDGTTDEADAVDAQDYYTDGDGDGYGNPASVLYSCSTLSGYVELGGDCDDADTTIYPDAAELCDYIDSNCDTVFDLELMEVYYTDADGDGYGDFQSPIAACSQPAGTVSTFGDCDDQAATVYPGAAESCNSIDDDCSGLVDDNPPSGSYYYLDSDRDGHGDPSNLVLVCALIAGYSATGDDCDDQSAVSYPGSKEVCDKKDNDCDGLIDYNATDQRNYYLDSDGDSYGSPLASMLACEPTAGYVDNDTDCEDNNAAVNTAATETCNGIDDNCDGSTDPSTSSGAATWYRDQDRDGYGDNVLSQVACTAPVGYANRDGDCNDRSSTISPSASELCDQVDNDCDGTVDEASATNAVTYYTDADGDGYGTGTGTSSCGQLPGVTTGGDCDDSNSAINPGMQEQCDLLNQDEDCDGVTEDNDSSAQGKLTFYEDTDGDGWGNISVMQTLCEVPTGYSIADGDCDDAQSTIYPGAAEVCNSVDDDCDGTINENAKDTQEPNDSQATKTQVSATNLNGTSVTPSITLHNSTDADWLYWTTDDERQQAHFSITMTTTNLSQSETISANLYYCKKTNLSCNVFDGAYAFTISKTNNTLADTNTVGITTQVSKQTYWYLQVSTSTWSTNYCNPITVTIVELP